MRRLFALIGTLAVALLAQPVLAAADPVKVVASMSVLGDLTQRVAGTNAAVATLVGPNVDAHTFDPTPADARSVKEAALVVTNGLNLEPWLPRLVKATGYKGSVVTATKGVTPRPADPHAWHDVANVRIYVRNIADGLAEVDPAHAADYRANAAAFTRDLDALDAEVKAAFARVAPGARKIITSHDAFGYYGAAYGLTLLAPEGLSTEAEPSAKAIAGLIDQIRKQRIKAIFVENVSDPRLIERIAREAGATVGGQLFSDALSAKDGPAATYLDMIRHNTRLITAALTGQP